MFPVLNRVLRSHSLKLSVIPKRFMGAFSHVSDNDPVILDREKRRMLKGNMKLLQNN